MPEGQALLLAVGSKAGSEVIHFQGAGVRAGGMVRLWPRRIDLDNTERLKSFEATTVVEDMAELEQAVTARLEAVAAGTL